MAPHVKGVTAETGRYLISHTEGNVLQLMEEVCLSEGEKRLTAELLQRLSYLSYVVARSTAELPDLPAVCPVNVR